jgi:hypothetical protein
LDETGTVHGPLPDAADLGEYNREDLEILMEELQQSVQMRIYNSVDLGSDLQHGYRIGQEQDLINSIIKYLAR